MKLTCFTLFCSLSLFSFEGIFNAKGLDVSLEENFFSGNFSSLSINNNFIQDNSFTIIENKLSVGGNTYKVELPKFLVDADDILISDSEVNSNKNNFSFFVSSLISTEPKSKVDFKRLRANCDSLHAEQLSFFDSFILNCLKKSKITLGAGFFGKKRALFKSSVRNVKLTSVNNNLEATLDINYFISGSGKITAQSSYDLSTKVLTLSKLNAKLGLLTVTNLVLNKLSELNSDIIKVDSDKKQIKFYLKDQI